MNITLFTPSKLQNSLMKLTSLKLKELNLANHRLNQLDSILQKELEIPIVYHHHGWSSTIVSVA